MKKLKKILVAVLILCLSIVPLSPISAAAAGDDGIMPRYNNTNTATANLSINDSGIMTINYKVSGYSGITNKIVITTYIEKRFLGVFWSRVDTGTTNDEWVDTINNYRYTGYRNFQLPSTGTYRVTINFKVHGSGGSADEIEASIKATY